jgi:hypothetical protein
MLELQTPNPEVLDRYTASFDGWAIVRYSACHCEILKILIRAGSSDTSPAAKILGTERTTSFARNNDFLYLIIFGAEIRVRTLAVQKNNVVLAEGLPILRALLKQFAARKRP